MTIAHEPVDEPAVHGSNPAEFFGPWEPDPVGSLKDFLELVSDSFSRWSSRNVNYAWRGVVNADWALHSALYRRMRWTWPARTKEAQMFKVESDILADAHRWGLHYLDRSHLPMLYQLAMLQHFGSPTRLIDVTFSPLVALYFAVEEQLDDHGQPASDHVDGRLFIFDVSDRLINERSSKDRKWEESYSRPWASEDNPIGDWTSSYWAWRPAPIEARFAAQNGAFIFGGVPSALGAGWRRSPSGSAIWDIETVRRATSVAVRFNPLRRGGGRPPNNPTFTVRVLASAKPQIRKELLAWFDIGARTIYPDHPGFAAFGVPQLHRRG